MHPPADTRCFPLAYLLTFRTHGTWLPGDARTSVDDSHNVPGTPPVPPIPARQRAAAARMEDQPVSLTPEQRECVDATLRDVCTHCGWTLHALAVRSNHVHVVVGASDAPEPVMTRFKAWATRRLVESGLLPTGTKLWARHGSTRYLWTRHAVDAACRYVRDMQDLPTHARVVAEFPVRSDRTAL